jgi:hypothetical protein
VTTYLSDPIPVDRGSIRAQIDARALELLPSLDTTSPGTTYDVLADVFAGLHAEALTTLTQMLAIAFRGSMEKTDRTIQRDAVQATATGTLTRTAADAAAGERIVDAGTEFNLQGADGNPVAFQTVNDETFTGTDDDITGVDLVAVLGGNGGNGLSTVLGPAQTVAWYQSLALGAATSGGEDGETDDEYLDRGADEKPGRAFTIVLPDDLARYLRNQPSVGRVQVVNNYNADTSTANVGGHITAIVVDDDGAALAGGTMTTLEASAQEIAVTDGEIHVTGPTDTLITVVFTGVAHSAFDASDVETRAEAAVLDFLDRSRFGQPDFGDEQAEWLDIRTVRYQDLVTVLNNVQGFDHYTSLTVNGGTADITMTGPGALPSASSTASGTVTAP